MESVSGVDNIVNIFEFQNNVDAGMLMIMIT